MTSDASQRQPGSSAGADGSSASWPMLQPVALDREWLRRRAVKLDEPKRAPEPKPRS